MIIKGSKIKLVKPMGVFTNVGEVCEVTNVADGGVISFRFSGCHLGCMSYDEYQKYFVDYVEPVKIKREWTEWKKECVYFYDIEKNRNKLYIIDVRDNGKKVQARLHIDEHYELRAEATCCNSDEFDYNAGSKLAIKRLWVKILNYEVAQLAKNM